MWFLWIVIGIAIGVVGYIGYDKYFNEAKILGERLLTKAGDFEKALAHINKL